MTDGGEGGAEPDDTPDDEPVDEDASSEPTPEDVAPLDWERLTERLGTGLPTGFTGSLTGANSPLARTLESLRESMRGQVLDLGTSMSRILEPFNATWRAHMAAIYESLPRFTIDGGLWSNSGFASTFKAVQEQQRALLTGLRISLGPLDSNLLRGFSRFLLPPNLRDYTGQISVSQVRTFLEEEGIALYLVPRGRTALRLLRAEDRAARRRVLGECYWTIVEDCATVLEGVTSETVTAEVAFVLDGIGAMRAGHHRSAQVLFTVTLDSLIPRFHPDVRIRRAITNRKKGAEVPDAIDEMNVRDAFVWLPIWNAHEQFWAQNGDRVPNYYSRHASVHGVSPRQFSKRNCVQVLMLVTSLIGYADRIPTGHYDKGRAPRPES